MTVEHITDTTPPEPPAAPPRATRVRRGTRWSVAVRRALRDWAGDAVAVLVLGVGMVAVVFRWDLDRLRAPLGLGDLLYAYATTSMWGRGAPFGDDGLGFPAGMHLPYYPTGDVVHNALAALFAQFTRDPFLPLNLVYATSFPLTALAALWLLRVVGVRGPLAVVAALGLTAVPFHWLRPDHVYLATMYTAVLAVVLALLVGSGRLGRAWRERRWPLLVATVVALVLLGTGGIYYACFAVLLVAVAALYRAFRGAAWRSVLMSLVPAVAVVLVLGASLLPSMLWVRAHPPIDEVAARLPVESVMYAGSLSLALLPAPGSDLPGAGVLGRVSEAAYADATAMPMSGVLVWSNSGSVFTVLAVAFLTVGALVVAVRRARAAAVTEASQVPRTADVPDRVSLSLVLTLLTAGVLFFVPWGLNFLFAFLVTPQLRGWDRMLPVLFALVVAGAGVVWRELRITAPVAVWGTAGVLAVVVLLDSVTPYRAHFDAVVAEGAAELREGRDFATTVNAAVPGECGVLQLPYVATPEAAYTEQLSAYAHFVPALTNPAKEWSFGAIAGTRDALLPEEIGSTVEPDEVGELEDAGFCAVQVDWRGYAPEDVESVQDELEALLGKPVATGRSGSWAAYALDGD
jgi:hypothetical protein